MAQEELDGVEYEKTLYVCGYQTQVLYFPSAIIEVPARGQRNYLRLIFGSTNFCGF